MQYRARVSARVTQHDVSRQCNLRCAHRPDMQVVHFARTGQTQQHCPHSLQIDTLRYTIKQQVQ